MGTKTKLMIYGANGYSARLIVDELISRGVKPLLAGRNKQEIEKLAAEKNCEWRAFDLSDDNVLLNSLGDIHTVLNCAGPFKYTAKDLIDASINSATNYLDITGEIPAMAYAFARHNSAVEKGVTLIPGVGFDVIPTDCLAKKLSEQMPDANYLRLGFLNRRGNISRGTWLTSLDFLGGTGCIRRDGKLVESPIGAHRITFEKNGFKFDGISIPWGDVYTAFHSTRIPNIEVYLGLPKVVVASRNFLLFLLKIIKHPPVKSFVAGYIKRNLTGPSETERNATETFVWGRVSNLKGGVIEECYRFLEGYNLTARGAAESALRVLENKVKQGCYTPSLAFGSSFMNLFVLERIF